MECKTPGHFHPWRSHVTCMATRLTIDLRTSTSKSTRRTTSIERLTIFVALALVADAHSCLLSSNCRLKYGYSI